MKNKLYVLLAALIMASCSAPRYSYYFDHHDPYAGRKQKTANAKEIAESPLAIDPASLEANASAVTTVYNAPLKEETVTPAAKNYFQMNKSEKKAFRHELKNSIKSYVTVKKKADSAQASKMDHDLMLAIIFGVAGIVFLAIGTQAFNIIGTIALIIGLVFFVKWLIRQ